MNLFEITNAGEPWAAERARYALQIHEAVGAGQLSPSEAKKLLISEAKKVRKAKKVRSNI